MNIALVDLNLLIVFDAVMREKHVTRAAKRIGMTQPAVSNALNRLRHIAKDDLFVRSPDGVVPTTRALQLGPPIRQAINLVENAFDPTSFDPINSSAEFNIAISTGSTTLFISIVVSSMPFEYFFNSSFYKTIFFVFFCYF